jgi:hypothetical protein
MREITGDSLLSGILATHSVIIERAKFKRADIKSKQPRPRLKPGLPHLWQGATLQG